jgi:hypothetical protein
MIGMPLIDTHGDKKTGVACTWIATSPLPIKTAASEVNDLVFLHRDPFVVTDAPPSTSMSSSPASKEGFTAFFHCILPAYAKIRSRRREDLSICKIKDIPPAKLF